MPAQRQPVADRPKPSPMQTSDLGIAIRDFIEGERFIQFSSGKHDVKSKIEFVDVSDPHNPVVHCDTGEVFTIRILRTG